MFADGSFCSKSGSPSAIIKISVTEPDPTPAPGKPGRPRIFSVLENRTTPSGSCLAASFKITGSVISNTASKPEYLATGSSLRSRATSTNRFSMLDTGVETGFKWGHEADCFTEADATKSSNASPSINPLRSSMMRTVTRWCGMTT